MIYCPKFDTWIFREECDYGEDCWVITQITRILCKECYAQVLDDEGGN